MLGPGAMRFGMTCQVFLSDEVSAAAGSVALKPGKRHSDAAGSSEFLPKYRRLWLLATLRIRMWWDGRVHGDDRYREAGDVGGWSVCRSAGGRVG
jgi:hypothetical protein